MEPISQGSRVRIIARNCRYFGHVGVVSATHAGSNYPYQIEGIGLWRFGDHEIALAPEVQASA